MVESSARILWYYNIEHLRSESAQVYGIQVQCTVCNLFGSQRTIILEDKYIKFRGNFPRIDKYSFVVLAVMKKNTSTLLSLSVIALLVLVPVFQALPLNLPPLLPEASAQGIVSVQHSQATHTTTASSSITLSSFTAGTYTNSLLVVAVEADSNPVNSVTFGGVSLTQASGSFQNDYTAFWYLKNPRGTANIVVTMAGASDIVVGAYVLSGVDQANPIPTTATNFTQANNPIQPNPTITLTTQYSNSTVIDSAALFGGSTLSGGCGTQGWDTQISISTVTGASSYKTQGSAGKVTCKWTNSASGNGWDDTAIEIKAAETAAPVTPIVLSGTSTASGYVPASSSQVTLYKFSPGNGPNRLLVVGVEQNWQSVNSITFGGVSLLKKTSSFINNDAEFWYLKNPSVTPADIVVTMSGGSRVSAFVIGAYAFSGVDQTTPIPNSATAHNTASSSPSITLTTTNPNEWVLDSPSIFGDATLSSPACNQQWNSNVQYNSTQKISGASSSALVPVAGSVTCKWTASPVNLWDDVAIGIKGVSLPTSTGILIPLYSYPWNFSSNTLSSYWNVVNQTKNNHPNVPIYVIINPNSGSCASTCPDPFYKKGIANLTKSGVVVLGYAFTSSGNRALGPDSSHNTVENDVKNYTTWYQPYGLKGMFFDEMNNVPGHETYYGNLTNYVHNTSKLTYSFGNPGAEIGGTYINSGSADLLDTNETSLNGTHRLMPTISDLQTATLSSRTNDAGFDKHNFSFLKWNVTSINGGLPNHVTLSNYTNYVGFFYITDNTGCASTTPYPCREGVADPWNTTSNYLGAMASALDHPSSIITINSTTLSGKPITGAFIQINQSGNVIPSGFTPYSFLGNQTIKYLFTPQKYNSTCSFDHWKNGSTTPARPMTPNSTSAAFTAVYSGTKCP